MYAFLYAGMPPPKKETGKKAAIIGAGPAALTAAYYLRNAGHSVTVIDKMDEPGFDVIVVGGGNGRWMLQ